MKQLKKAAWVGVLVMGAALVATPANGAESDADPDAVVAIQEVAPEVFTNLAPASELKDAQSG